MALFGVLRGLNVYESCVTVNIPLLRCRLRSFSVMLDSRVSSSCSVARRRHKLWNSHSGQCLLRIRSGGEFLESRVAMLAISRRTLLARAPVFTTTVALSSPWMILPMPTSRPNISDNTMASKAKSNLSSLLRLFLATNRMGMSSAELFVHRTTSIPQHESSILDGVCAQSG